MARFRICKERKTPAGTATECIGLTLHAPTAQQAVKNAKTMFPHYGDLVAIPEEN